MHFCNFGWWFYSKLHYYDCCCTVCTALLFSYSAIFIAASVRNKLIHSNLFPGGLETPSNSIYIIGPHKCTCQMAFKSVERFKQGARMWQTTDRQTTLRKKMCGYVGFCLTIVICVCIVQWRQFLQTPPTWRRGRRVSRWRHRRRRCHVTCHGGSVVWRSVRGLVEWATVGDQRRCIETSRRFIDWLPPQVNASSHIQSHHCCDVNKTLFKTQAKTF